MTLKAIKHETTKIIELVKFRYQGGDIEETPEYMEAVDKHEKMQSQISAFIKSTEQIVSQFQQLFTSSNEFSNTLLTNVPEMQTFEKVNLPLELQKFSQTLQGIGNEKLIKKCNEQVLAPLTEYITEIDSLDKVKKEHYDYQLILSGNRSKLAKLKEKLAEQSKIEIYEQKIIKRANEIVELENSFIKSVEDLWAKRVEEIHQPLMALFTILRRFSVAINDKSKDLSLAVGKDICQQNFDSGEIPVFTEPAMESRFSLPKFFSAIG